MTNCTSEEVRAKAAEATWLAYLDEKENVIAMTKEFGWISVDERLPEKCLMNVLVWVEMAYGIPDIFKVVGWEYDRFNFNGGANKITHWCIPTPPKEK